jgi:hypothetical protein
VAHQIDFVEAVISLLRHAVTALRRLTAHGNLTPPSSRKKPKPRALLRASRYIDDVRQTLVMINRALELSRSFGIE